MENNNEGSPTSVRNHPTLHSVFSNLYWNTSKILCSDW